MNIWLNANVPEKFSNNPWGKVFPWNNDDGQYI